jgi:tyrosyl-tRNA synthetase
MGKTSTGERIWLDAARTSAFEFYKYWFNVGDDDVGRFLKMFSLRPVAELDELLRAHDADRAPRTAQRELARALTSWVHGDVAVTRVESANRVFATGTLDGLELAELAALAETIPTVDVPRAELTAGVGIVDLLARTVADSKGAARRLIQQGGAYINNVRISELEHKVTAANLAGDLLLLVRGGKTNYKLVRAV